MSDHFLKINKNKAVFQTADGFTPYRTNKTMRTYSSRPGTTDEDGNLVYVTEQAHKEACDINNIIKTYDAGLIISRVQTMEARYGDISGLDYKQALDLVIGAKTAFTELPAKIRKEFDNNPQKYLEFMDNPDNRDKAIELGLIRKDTSSDIDGLGEHVKDGKKVDPPQADPPEAA